MFQLQAPSFIMFNDEQVTFTRQAKGSVTYQAGMPVADPSQATTFTIPCNVQSDTAGDDDLPMDVEGQMADDAYVLFCPAGAQMPQSGDLFERNGATYQVLACENWGGYTRARAVNSQALADYQAAQSDNGDG